LVLDEHYLSGSDDGLIREVRQVAPGAAILVCSRYEDGEWRERIAEIGPHAVVLKPISPSAIGAALREIYPTPAGSAQ
jgi:DNA-binding NarL/FixJ family response regulator